MKTTKMLGKFGDSWRNLVPDGLKFAMFLVLCATMLPKAAEADAVCYEYLTISGSSQTVGAYLLTDYVPKSNTVVRAKYASSENGASGKNQFLFCSRKAYSAATENLHFSFAPNVSGKFNFYYYGSQHTASNGFTANKDYELLVSGGKAYVTDTTTSEVVAELGSGFQSFSPQYKMAFFKSYAYSDGTYGSWANAFHGKFHYIRIYDIENGEEVLKHNFVPCVEGGATVLCDIADPGKTRYALTVDSTASVAVGGEVIEVIGGESYNVTESGTFTLDAPSFCNLRLANLAAECIFDQTGDTVSAECAHSFNGFSSAADSSTFFRGGWWDFSAAGQATNFWGAADAMSNRYTEFSDGAVVTNVSYVYVAGTAGTNNQLRLTGASSLYGESLVLGRATTAGQKSKVTVDGGSLLSVSGALEFSDGEKFRGASEQTGNSLTVSGEGSRLVVGGQTSLGRNRDASDSQYMRFGGNTFTVTDGASATLGALAVDSGAAFGGESNRVVFSDNARVTMTSLSFATAGASGGHGGNLLEILDGAVVTNTGAMQFGTMRDTVKDLSSSIIVSNAVFHTGFANYASNGRFLIHGSGYSFVLSGPAAELTVHDGVNGIFRGKHNSFILENGVSWNSVFSSYSYTLDTSNNTVRVRTGAALNFPSGIATCGGSSDGRTKSGYNKLIVESGASVNTDSSKNINIYGLGSELIVDDGTVNCGGNVHVGSTESYDTNCLAKVCGTHPKMTIAKSLDVKNGSCLRFELPATGYDVNAATGENPLLDVGATAGNGIYLDETSRLEFAGAEELLAYHKQTKERRDYVLAQAESIGISAEQIAAASVGLPKGMTLTNTGTKLVLRVSPQRPLIIIVR
ncbi:MAG: hypothetical protein K6G94_05110 [Kiritimatiellae bacterium]|nr:hypothetical protein [Kiritimatiellia bacterium]